MRYSIIPLTVLLVGYLIYSIFKKIDSKSVKVATQEFEYQTKVNLRSQLAPNNDQNIIPDKNSNKSNLSAPEAMKIDKSSLENFLVKLSEDDRLDFVEITTIFQDFNPDKDSINSLAIRLNEKGYSPQKKRQGYPDTGLRQVITLNELHQGSRLLKEFYVSFLESDKKLVFDRFYYAYTMREGLFEQLSLLFDKRLLGVALSKTMSEDRRFVRWELEGDRFVFIDGSHIFKGEESIFVGLEHEIH